MIMQYSNDNSYGEETTFDSKKVLYAAAAVVVLIIIAASAFFIISGDPEQKDDCGNGVCEASENCGSCVKDCSCKTDEVCKNKKCVKKDSTVVCGNGKCETGENENNCCDDCPCTSDNMECNSETHKCEASAAPKVICGDGDCDVSENCFDCKDCRCKSGEICSPKSKTCVKPVCGNGECESGEYIYNCCDDCGCSTPNCEVCNKETHLCEVPEAKISDESAVEFVTKYYQDKGYVVEEIVVDGSTCTYDKPSKSVSVKLEGNEFIMLVRVMEDGEIVELPTN